MKQLFILFFVAFTSSLNAQELLGQEFWPDGTLRSTRYSEGSRIHFITYHENGKMKEVGCFQNGRRDGVWKQYAESGALITKAGFTDGVRQGIWEFAEMGETHASGRLVFEHGLLKSGEQFSDEGLLTAHRTYP